jgi:hypothetical protein
MPFHSCNRFKDLKKGMAGAGGNVFEGAPTYNITIEVWP